MHLFRLFQFKSEVEQKIVYMKTDDSQCNNLVTHFFKSLSLHLTENNTKLKTTFHIFKKRSYEQLVFFQIYFQFMFFIYNIESQQ